MQSNTLSKSKKSIVPAIFFLLAYIMPESLFQIAGFNSFYNLYRLAVAGIILLRFNFRHVKKPSFVPIWCAFECWILIMTFLRNGAVVNAAKEAVLIVSCVMLFDLYRDDFDVLWKALFSVLELFIYINFLTILLYPDGMYVTGETNLAYENWFLGFKNKHIIYYLPAMGSAVVLSKKYGYNPRRILLIIATYISAVCVHSSTGILVLSVFLLMSLIPFFGKHPGIFNLRTYFITTIVLFILIPILRMQRIFSYIIVNILGKSLDLTYRTDLWDKATSAIAQHLLTGWGNQSSEVKHILYNSASIVSAHNQILEYWYIGGIVLLLLYLIINMRLVKMALPYKDVPVVQTVSALYMALQIALIVEVYTDASIYMIYFMLWYTCAEYAFRGYVKRKQSPIQYKEKEEAKK